jgi:hypothetical protein
VTARISHSAICRCIDVSYARHYCCCVCYRCIVVDHIAHYYCTAGARVVARQIVVDMQHRAALDFCPHGHASLLR